VLDVFIDLRECLPNVFIFISNLDFCAHALVVSKSGFAFTMKRVNGGDMDYRNN
jgi:hypothetical protein